MTKFKFKKASILLLAVPLMIFATATGDLDNISAAIKAGNSKALAEYFDNTVEVKIANKEGAYSKSQAEAIVKDFLNLNLVMAVLFGQCTEIAKTIPKLRKV